MALPDDLSMREADAGDLAAISALREAAGWSVHGWALRAVVQQRHARCVVVTDASGELAGIGSGISYAPLGFIGNMVVAQVHRRRGVGTAILDDVASWLERAGCLRLELNATDEGERLYARHGFASRGQSAVARVPRATNLDGDPTIATRRATADDLDSISAYDRPRFGGDRRPILALLLADRACRAAVAERDGALAGFAVVRLDEPRLGPMVADAPPVAAALLSWAFDAMPATDEMRLNLPPGNEPGAAWLRGLDVPIEAWAGRMARGPDIPRRDGSIYQMAVGPLG